MADKRTSSNLNRTLLIILGIVLALLLTMNARSLSFADLQGNRLSKPVIEKITPRSGLTLGEMPSLKKFFKFASR